MCNMRKVAIIGANSYIAKNLKEYLNAKYAGSVDINLYDIQPDGGSTKNYTQIDFEDEKSLENIDFSCDVLFFFTGLTGTKAGFDKYEQFIKVNEVFLINFLKAYIRKQSRAKIIYPSTRLMYASSDKPIKETALKAFKSIYSVNKYAAEKYLEVFSNIYNIPYCVLRICVPYGSLPGIEPTYGTYEFFTKQAEENKEITVFGDGTSRRTFTHIIDICEVLVQAANNKSCLGVYNVGGDTKTLGELAQIIAKKNNATVKYVTFPAFDEKLEVKHSVFDSSKLDKLLKFSYRTISGEG